MAVTSTARMPGDPVLRAMGRLTLTRGTRVTDSAVVIILLVVILNAVDGLLRPMLTLGGQPIPPLSSPDAQQMAAWAFLAVPVAMYLYFWLPGSLSTLIPELRDNGVIADPRAETEETIDEFEASARRRYERGWFVIPAVLLIAIYSAVKFRQLPAGSPMTSGQLALDLVASAPVIYAATLSFFRMVAGIRVTSDLFRRFEVRVFPHHPDGAGGFDPLGKRVTILAWAGAVAGTAAFIINFLSLQQGNNLLASMESVFGVGVLLVVAPLVLWFWLRGPHEAMVMARGSLLAGICGIYDRVARTAIADREATKLTTTQFKQSTDLLLELDRRSDEIMKTYPAWPIHTTALRTAWAAVSAPLIAGVIGIVISNVRTLVGGG